MSILTLFFLLIFDGGGYLSEVEVHGEDEHGELRGGGADPERGGMALEAVLALEVVLALEAVLAGKIQDKILFPWRQCRILFQEATVAVDKAQHRYDFYI